MTGESAIPMVAARGDTSWRTTSTRPVGAVDVLRWVLLARWVFLLIYALGGCTSGSKVAEPTGTMTTPAATAQPAASRCDTRETVMDARNVLSVKDVNASAAGGLSVTEVDYGACAPFQQVSWRCDLAFPWQVASSTGPAMAALGVKGARVAYLATSTGSVTETILTVDPVKTSGAAVLKKLSTACPGPVDKKVGAWIRLGATSKVAAMSSGPLVVAVDFTEGGLGLAEQGKVLRAAASALESN